MRSEFDDLRCNELHQVSSDTNGDKQVVKIYRHGQLIAKRVKQKKSIRYFGIDDCQQFLSEQ
jgi:uncharacterized protein (UPF0210 family)